MTSIQNIPENEVAIMREELNVRGKTPLRATSLLSLPAAVLLSALLGACGDTAPPELNTGANGPVPVATTEAQVRAAAAASSVTDLLIESRTDGGLSVTGKINTVPFAARFPEKWNGGSVLEAHGYSQKELVPDPAKDPSFGLLSAAYAQGYAAADTAYAKTGYAVKEGVEANKALHDFLAKAGSLKQYITGISMGGNITVALAEKYPSDFIGALPYCGVVAGWSAQQRFLLDFRLVYDAFTKGTPYALPGNGDALTPNAALSTDLVTKTVVGLFTKAAQGDKPALAIVGQVAKVTGTPADPVSFITPLASAVYGLADQLQTAGGNGYSNVGKVYVGSFDDKALNAGVQRLTAADAATKFLADNYTPTGKFTLKMLSFHNTSDPLVPYGLEPEFKATVAAAGNSANLVQQIVQPKAVDQTATSGPAHCYFSPKEVIGAWNDLRAWVENGVKPTERDITNKP
jgi:pimeloyl-ACP methyl ester carboxylesterase